MVAMLMVGANVFFFQSRDVLRHFPDIGFADDAAAYSRMLTDILVHGVAAHTPPSTINKHNTKPQGGIRKKVVV
jgi:TetR/AcrR family transcriptional regulator